MGTEIRKQLPGWRERVVVQLTGKGIIELSVVMKMFHTCFGKWFHKNTQYQNISNLHLRSVHFLICKLYPKLVGGEEPLSDIIQMHSNTMREMCCLNLLTNFKASFTQKDMPKCHSYIWFLPAIWLEKERATHSSVLAWRIPGTVEPGGLPSMGSHRVGHDWSDLAAAAAAVWLAKLHNLSGSRIHTL